MEQRYHVSGQARRTSELGRRLKVDDRLVKQAKKHRQIRHPLLESVDAYLVYLADRADDLFTAIPVNASLDFTLLDLRSMKEMQDIAHAASVLGYTDSGVGAAGGHVLMKLDGWARADDLRRDRYGRTAFMAMKFDNETMDRVFQALKAGLDRTGFDLIKLDEDPAAGLIDDRLRVEIRRARFLVADLTHANPGAYWEAGFAEGLGKPVIYTCEETIFDEGRGTHFDTNHHLTVTWSADALEEAVNRLVATVRATLPEEAVMEDAPELTEEREG